MGAHGFLELMDCSTIDLNENTPYNPSHHPSFIVPFKQEFRPSDPYCLHDIIRSHESFIQR